MNLVLGSCSKPSAVRKNPCLKSTIEQLYEQRHETGDIKFIIGYEQIPAHRCILAALSPKYKAQFYGAMAEKDVVNVNGVSADAFKEFLQFFYMDEVTLSIENIEDVLNLAKQSLVDELIAECTNFLLDVIGLDKLLWCYRLALDYEIQPLDEFCVKYICANIKSVFKTADFRSCERDVLCQILDLNSLNCNETDVFDACIAWAQAKCERHEIDGADTANLRTVLSNAIMKIRFCSMTVKQFATIDKNYSGLLLSKESIEVYRTIALKTSGEISNIFGANNCKPRKLIQLDCSFSTGSPIKFISPVDSDSMNFSCDKTINLIGFVICNRIDDNIIVHVNISGIPQLFEHTKSVTNNETRIIFDYPIQVDRSRWCQIIIASETFKRSSNNWYGFNIKRNTVQNDVSFQFPDEFCLEINLITRLLFSTTDE